MVSEREFRESVVVFLIYRKGLWVIKRSEEVGEGFFHLCGIRDVIFNDCSIHVDIIIGGLSWGRAS